MLQSIHCRSLVSVIDLFGWNAKEECIRTMWKDLFDVEKGCFVMTCPQDKVEEYTEDFKELGFEIEVREYETVLNSSFDSCVCF